MSDLLNGPATGELLDGRYRLVSRVGAGGMATVYHARDELLGRDVAVKLFRPMPDDPQSRQRRRAETQLLAALNHPSLVTLFDARVDEDDHPYLVMEYVDGPTLRDRMAAGPISRREIAETGAALADALAVVHDAGIVHRDVKPSNVLLRTAQLPGIAPSVTLADFGIAYLLDSSRITTPGTMIGTAAYIAPEQVRGEQPAPPSDIYALGLMLLEMLTGRHPFPAGTPQEVFALRLTGEPEIPADLGPQWRALLTAMTDREPDRRPSATEVADAARALAAEEMERSADVDTASLDTTQLSTATPGTAPLDTAPDTADPVSVTADALATRDDDATRPFPVEQSDLAIPAARADSATPLSSFARADEHAPSRRRALTITVGAVLATVLVALALAIGGPALFGSAEQPDPPALPQVDDPLGGHLDDLMEAVTP
ncbi:serine/threonine-protein kinase [Microbacterium oryzae]|uniref:serine/threonine-protein kinase n=1 Tax=Microbacterium oryzae TaxID=743009 RepID=UPI0025AFA929|nr:serine/threonine-protein kinase [Microbacterium oryzae]MDN3310238.1 serine/threonine-protein kinase [Microbacterium oryzae]